MANMFDLKQLIPGGAKQSAPYSHKVNSDSDKAALLENYKEVVAHDWDKLPVGIHIRYENSDGDFKRGGFIAAHYVSNKQETLGHNMMRLRSTPSHGGKEWSIDTANISRIWKNAKYEPAQDANAELKLKTESLSAQVDQLRIELAHVVNEQKRTIALIKKLHNIQF